MVFSAVVSLVIRPKTHIALAAVKGPHEGMEVAEHLLYVGGSDEPDSTSAEPTRLRPVDVATYPFASHYSRAKYAAERIVLSAHEPPHFCTCALRLPGLYGLGDQLIVEPLLRGTLSRVPSGGDGCRVDFCYVENAAHAHVVALDALLRRPKHVGGRAFNVTNGEQER